MKDSFSKLSPMLEQYNFEEALNGIRYSFAEMADVIGLKNIEILQNIDFSRVFKDSFYRERYDENCTGRRFCAAYRIYQGIRRRGISGGSV